MWRGRKRKRESQNPGTHIEPLEKYCSARETRGRERRAARRSVNRIIRAVKSGKNVCATTRCINVSALLEIKKLPRV